MFWAVYFSLMPLLLSSQQKKDNTYRNYTNARIQCNVALNVFLLADILVEIENRFLHVESSRGISLVSHSDE